MKKNQALFSSKDKSKKLKCRLLQFLFGAFRVKLLNNVTISSINYVSHQIISITYYKSHFSNTGHKKLMSE